MMADGVVPPHLGPPSFPLPSMSPPNGPFFGGPLGPAGGHPCPPRPRVRRGDVRSAILALLAEHPLNGYQLIQRINERSQGVWRPSPGSIYPALQQLEDEGMVRAEAEGGRRRFHLTDAGRRHVEENPDAIDAMWAGLAQLVTDELVDLQELLQQVIVALEHVARAGSGHHLAEAGRVLSDTRRALYRILADDVPPPVGEQARDEKKGDGE